MSHQTEGQRFGRKETYFRRSLEVSGDSVNVPSWRKLVTTRPRPSFGTERMRISFYWYSPYKMWLRVVLVQDQWESLLNELLSVKPTMCCSYGLIPVRSMMSVIRKINESRARNSEQFIKGLVGKCKLVIQQGGSLRILCTYNIVWSRLSLKWIIWW